MLKHTIIVAAVAGLVLALAPAAQADITTHGGATINMDFVAVGNAGNAADTTGHGAVAYDYDIGKYEVTAGQYAEFLNAVATTDP